MRQRAACVPSRAAATMRNQMSDLARPRTPHVWRLAALLIHVAVMATECMEVPLDAVRRTETASQDFVNNDMVTSNCRLGHEVGCSTPVQGPHGFSRRSRKELLFPLLKPVEEQPKNIALFHDTDTRTTLGLSEDFRKARRSAAGSESFSEHGRFVQSGSASLARTSITDVSRLRPQSWRSDAKQVISQSMNRGSSNPSSSSRSYALNSSLPRSLSGSSKHGVGPLEPTNGNGPPQLSSPRQSVSRNNLDGSSASNETLHSASGGLGREDEYRGNRQFRRRDRTGVSLGHDTAKQRSHKLLQDSELDPNDVVDYNVNTSSQLWTAPPMESGRLITITVAQGEDADFCSIQEAVDSVPEHNTQRIIIRIHAGTYREKVVVPHKKPFISFHGDEHGGTVVSWNATASSNDERNEPNHEARFAATQPNATRALFGTMNSATVTILSDGFVAQHMVFENSAPQPEPGAVGAQAVAFLIGGDRATFYHCSFLGAQDTLYDYVGRHYYMNCYIQGSIDFIFGNGRSLFEGCHLHSIATSFGAIAAHQRLSPEDDTGFSFDRCSVTGSGTLYLGRAWSPYARIVFARTYLENIIAAEGWSDFGDPQRRSTTFFGQYQLTGPGANLSRRVQWAKLLTDDDVLPYLGGQWLRNTAWHNGTYKWPVCTRP